MIDPSPSAVFVARLLLAIKDTDTIAFHTAVQDAHTAGYSTAELLVISLTVATGYLDKVDADWPAASRSILLEAATAAD